jgi:phage baseplate assembly protein W
MEADTPVHLSSPFTFTKNGAKTIEQGTPEDVTQCVYRVAVFPEGTREDSPEYGIPSLLFSTAPLDVTLVAEAIERWEPRASLESSEMAEGLQRARQDAIEVA